MSQEDKNQEDLNKGQESTNSPEKSFTPEDVSLIADAAAFKLPDSIPDMPFNEADLLSIPDPEGIDMTLNEQEQGELMNLFADKVLTQAVDESAVMAQVNKENEQQKVAPADEIKPAKAEKTETQKGPDLSAFLKASNLDKADNKPKASPAQDKTRAERRQNKRGKGI